MTNSVDPIKNQVYLDLDVPFLNLLGVKLHRMSDGEGEISLAVEEKHLNTWGSVHGGVLLSLADAAMAIAARAADPNDRSVVTIELKNTFMRATEGSIRVIGKSIHTTATMAFCEAKLIDQHGQLCSMATGTFKYFKRSLIKDPIRSQSESSQSSQGQSD
jgi:uncharacterized protein (TIGR00369 family)